MGVGAQVPKLACGDDKCRYVLGEDIEELEVIVSGLHVDAVLGTLHIATYQLPHHSQSAPRQQTWADRE